MHFASGMVYWFVVFLAEHHLVFGAMGHIMCVNIWQYTRKPYWAEQSLMEVLASNNTINYAGGFCPMYV